MVCKLQSKNNNKELNRRFPRQSSLNLRSSPFDGRVPVDTLNSCIPSSGIIFPNGAARVPDSVFHLGVEPDFGQGFAAMDSPSQFRSISDFAGNNLSPFANQRHLPVDAEFG
jgi:hypothetical protein